MVGIILALIFRGIFIAVGAAAIDRFSWVFFLFGGFLIYTAVKLVIDYRHHDDETTTRRTTPRCGSSSGVSLRPTDFRGTKLIVIENGKRLITPMLVVIVALGSTDLLFALDSIPAIYGLTQEPYLVFTANVFALMGLRQLYFLIGGLLKRLVYLSLGLSVILGVHRRQAGAPRPAPVPPGRLGPVRWRDPDLALAMRDHRNADHHDGGQPGQGRQRDAGNRGTRSDMRKA